MRSVWVWLYVIVAVLSGALTYVMIKMYDVPSGIFILMMSVGAIWISSAELYDEGPNERISVQD